MIRQKQNQRGFTAVEALIIIVVLAAIGVAGYFVAKHADTKNTPTAITQSTQTASTTANPYAGWKSYCSSVEGVCLKFPTNWTLTVGSSANPNLLSNQAEITSPSGLVAVQSYWNAGGGAGDEPVAFANHIISITPTKATGISAVEAETTETVNASNDPNWDYSTRPVGSAEYLADYLLESNQEIQAAGVTAGSTTTGVGVIGDDDFSSSNGGEALTITPSNTKNSFSSLVAVQAWLSEPEVKTAGQIMSSVTEK